MLGGGCGSSSGHVTSKNVKQVLQLSPVSQWKHQNSPRHLKDLKPYLIIYAMFPLSPPLLSPIGCVCLILLCLELCVRGCVFTSFLQVVQGPEDGEGQLARHIEEGSHDAAGLVGVLHLGAKLVHDVPHRNFLLCGLHMKAPEKRRRVRGRKAQSSTTL